MLNIDQIGIGTMSKVSLEGRLDDGSAPQLEQYFKENLNGISELVIDTAKLEYISCDGLRVFLSALKTMDRQGGIMIIENVYGEVKEMIDSNGFSNIFTIK